MPLCETPPVQLPRRPAALVFDMDGLIFDTESLYQEAFALAVTEGGHTMPPETFLGMVGRPWPPSRTVLLETHGADFPVDELVAAWRRHFDLIVETRLALKPGVVELLDTLDQLKLPRAIATSSSHRTADHHLAAHGLANRFDTVVVAGDYANGKPAPDPFLKAAERLGVDPALCLAMEDSYNGARSASAAGMMTIMIPDLPAPTDEIAALCTFVLPDLHAVRRLVLAGR